jgi:hypothetical protein
VAQEDQGQRRGMTDDEQSEVMRLRAMANEFYRTADKILAIAEDFEKQVTGEVEIGDLYFVTYAVVLPGPDYDPHTYPLSLIASPPRHAQVRADGIADAMRKAAMVDFNEWMTTPELEGVADDER